jgi:hypothetical protein
MPSWRDYAKRKDDGPEPCAISAICPPEAANSAPNGTNGTNGTGLPPSIRQGLTWLANARAPRLVVPDAWPIAVADALRLASDGWAEKALALGWSELDLFGAVADRNGDPYADGLAVKLGGRTILALCGTFATVSSGGAGRAYLHRGNNEGAVLMWALGRGR